MTYTWLARNEDCEALTQIFEGNYVQQRSDVQICSIQMTSTKGRPIMQLPYYQLVYSSCQLVPTITVFITLRGRHSSIFYLSYTTSEFQSTSFKQHARFPSSRIDFVISHRIIIISQTLLQLETVLFLSLQLYSETLDQQILARRSVRQHHETNS